jgi:hypothetical protein
VRRLLLLGAAVLVAGCGSESPETGGREPPRLEAAMLRLADLPAGFHYGDDRGCGEVGTTEGSLPALDDFIIETRPRACFGEFSRAYGAEPGQVLTALFLFESDADAERAWERREQLLGSYNSIFITKERARGEVVEFDSRGLNAPGAGETWRDGRLIVAVYEEGLTGDPGRRFARDLAETQRRRIDSPSEPVAKQEDDREVGLDDPAIAVPVYWLGREFAPERLTPLELYRGDHLGGAGPGNEVKIDYQGERASVTLDLWKPTDWKNFKTTRLGKMIWSSPCARRSDLKAEGGRAEIYGGYSKRCEGEPDHWLAHVYYPEVVVAVNMSYCYMCGGRSSTDPYNSREGMEAVVRGLTPRG